jgi:predicted DCC family thiol-disulfide oxidoreductase YuxK
MSELLFVRRGPEKPLLIYDGDCGFCCFWIDRWRKATGPHIEYLPFQDSGVERRFPEIPRARLETAVHLVQPDGGVYSGADAVFRSLASNPSRRWPLWIYQNIPGAAWLSEWGYRMVARHRSFFSALTRLLWGHKDAPELQR